MTPPLGGTGQLAANQLLNPVSPQEITAECPCVGHCTTALGDDVCRSCLRTLDEVTHWPQMSETERRAVNRRIAGEHGGVPAQV